MKLHIYAVRWEWENKCRGDGIYTELVTASSKKKAEDAVDAVKLAAIVRRQSTQDLGEA